MQGAFDRIKILGDGELTKTLTVTAHAFSQSAKEKIEKAGGKVELSRRRRRPPKPGAEAERVASRASPAAQSDAADRAHVS